MNTIEKYNKSEIFRVDKSIKFKPDFINPLTRDLRT